eukprot:Plantae.Rhodophyta-Purpureofilum_apyrenoidigerum.ctg19329.p1 GENE.Plantae.Rhodophyta-Purpureofilum_apyrenoidigerum.ctg19329~~Plantae.Rhodophyta-Purpureofilum_apyrenoidigerum.ctg19329.p1  ORF type:complete len:209 (-),score=42.00 Plantae.Rhodophyta-Purpureofilum_apyrenoidigerum.ctg19329:166-792(-)
MVGFVLTPALAARARQRLLRTVNAREQSDRRTVATAGLEGISSFDQLFKRFLGGTKEEKEDTKLEGTYTSMDIQTDDTDIIILTTSIQAKQGDDKEMIRLLKTLQDKTLELEVPHTCRSIAINRDPEDSCAFQMVELLNGIKGMTMHQKSEHYQAFIRTVQPLLANSLGVHVCRVRNGRISDGLYPYGPAGEGGRDDMVYSGSGKSKR